jgi:Flp pilus assembly protein CpaB
VADVIWLALGLGRTFRPPEATNDGGEVTPVANDRPSRPATPSGGVGTFSAMGRQIQRPTLPASRALVGGLLVIVAAVGVFAAYQGAGSVPATSYVVAEATLAPGTRLTARVLSTAAIDLPDTQADRAYTSIEQLEGAVTLAPLEPGDLIMGSAVLDASRATGDQAAHEFSFSVDRDHAMNGGLVVGDRVDVLATYGAGEASYTIVAARDATVLAVDDGSSGGIGSPGTIVVSVALTSASEVLRVAHAAETSALTIVRATRADDPLPERYGPIDDRPSDDGPAEARS